VSERREEFSKMRLNFSRTEGVESKNDVVFIQNLLKIKNLTTLGGNGQNRVFLTSLKGGSKPDFHHDVIYEQPHIT
jgi:hypothetical protein